MSPPTSGVPFSFFCSLIREISKLRPLPSKTRVNWPTNYLNYPALNIFRRWVEELRKRFAPLPPNTTAICFRMLFPEEDIRRKFDIQETRMANLLEDCFGIDATTFQKWSMDTATGCLGQELKVVLEQTCPQETIGPLTIAEVDDLLDELASNSGYSHASIRSKYPKGRRRTRAALFRALFRTLSPEDASVLTQIILKDLKPLLYPLTEFHYTVALTKFNVTAVRMLIKEHAMDIWDPSGVFLQLYRVRAHMDDAAALADLPASSRPSKFTPTIGSPIAIPKSEKARGCEHGLKILGGSNRVWAETKYDGERAQIHVQINMDGSSRITIFSKSKRDSTNDRHAVHSVIRSALGLDSSRGNIRQNVILDAEMVAFRDETIDEFWRIRQLVEDTAHGIRGRRRAPSPESDAQESMNSHFNEALSLGVVFFDVLYLESESLLSWPYAQRREILESLIQTKPGKVILAERHLIDMTERQPVKALYKIFAEHIAASEEGLVLKAEDSKYNDYRKPWIKLKRDYLPDAGDKLDLVILGASWEKVRGRSLRVPPSTFTTFYVGSAEIKEDRIIAPAAKPNFHVYFTVSYGLSREDLEHLNFFIKSSDPISYSYSSLNKCDLPFTIDLFDGLEPPPTVILRQPVVVSLYGAGFTKAPRSRHYELRFPRMTRFYLPSERKWQDASNLEVVHRVALESVGRDRADKDISDWVKMAWGKVASPKANCSLKRKTKIELWIDKLSRLDGNRVLYEVSPTPTRRPSSENERAQHEAKRNVRPKMDSPPLTTRTNLMGSPISVKTPKKSDLPWERSDCLVWFAQPGENNHRPCSSMGFWKKRITRERRLHSLDSLLMGCGWTSDTGLWKQGVIIVDECDGSGGEWITRITERVKEMPDRTRNEIVVYSCQSTVLFKLM